MTSVTDTRLEQALQARYEKSAAALLAVAQVIERNRLLDGGADEFLRLVADLESVDAAAFTRVWQDPFSYWWTRLAYQLVAACLNSGQLDEYGASYYEALEAEEPQNALLKHLEEFKRISLGLALASGRDVSFDKPLTAVTPAWIPGTRLTVDGSGSVRIAGVRDGAVVGPAGERLATRECPVASDGVFDWRLQPAVYRLPALGVRTPDDALDVDWQATLVTSTEVALDLIRRFAPELTIAFEASPRIISFKHHSLTDNFRNVTHSELPGAFLCSFGYQPHYLADSIVHEFYHGLLFAIEEQAPLFETGAGQKLGYYSPWRGDLRDLDGVMHAFYVFIACARFWLGLRRNGGDTGPEHDYVTDRLIRIPLQLRVAEAVLLEHGKFSLEGGAFFAELRQELAALLGEIDALGLPDDMPGLVCEDVIFNPQTDKLGRQMSVREIVEDHGRQVEIETGLSVSPLIAAAIA